MPAIIRGLALCLAFCFAAPLVAEEATPPVDLARVAAARDLMDVTGVTKQMDGMMDAISRGFSKSGPAESSEAGKARSAEFDAGLKKLHEYKDQMIADFANLYAQTFTAEEMKTVADFYRTGAGAKFIAKTPELMQKGAALGMKYSEMIGKAMQPEAAAPVPAPVPDPAKPK
jgi:hypothetical protein